MNIHVMDTDVCSMYAWSPLVVKQSQICKLLKQKRNGKSRRAKTLAKRRLRLYRNAWIEYDTIKDMDWTKKNISKMEMLTNPIVDLEISFDFEAFKKENKECLNEIYGSLT